MLRRSEYGPSMTKQAAFLVSLVLLCVGVGSAAGGRAGTAQSSSLAASQRETRLGPQPTPRWYWRWTVWYPGAVYARGQAGQRILRPKQAPRRIPDRAWRRLHFLLLARQDRTLAGEHKRRPRKPRRRSSGIGVLAYAGHLTSVGDLSRYSMVIGSSWSNDAPLLQHAAGRSLTYFDAMDVAKTYSTGVTYSKALAHGWLLKNSSGNYLINSKFGTYCADVGSPTYQQAWIRNVLRYLHAHRGVDGVFNDNTMSDPKAECGGYPASYPSTSAWSAATLSFVKAAYSALHAHGYYLALNAGAYIPGDRSYDDGTSTINWWKRVGPFSDGLMNENYAQTSGGPKEVRASGSAWYQEWDGWQRLVPTAQSMGKDFIGLTEQSCTNTATMTYAKASFLLGWNGGGSVFIYTCGSSNSANSAWTTNIGTPRAAKVRVGAGYQRAFTDGTVLVNPSASVSQKFTVGGTSYTLAPTTARILPGT